MNKNNLKLKFVQNAITKLELEARLCSSDCVSPLLNTPFFQMITGRVLLGLSRLCHTAYSDIPSKQLVESSSLSRDAIETGIRQDGGFFFFTDLLPIKTFCCLTQNIRHFVTLTKLILSEKSNLSTCCF